MTNEVTRFPILRIMYRYFLWEDLSSVTMNRYSSLSHEYDDDVLLRDVWCNFAVDRNELWLLSCTTLVLPLYGALVCCLSMSLLLLFCFSCTFAQNYLFSSYLACLALGGIFIFMLVFLTTSVAFSLDLLCFMLVSFVDFGVFC